MVIYTKFNELITEAKRMYVEDQANVMTVLGFILAGIVMMIGVVIFSSINTGVPVYGLYGCWSAVGNTLISNAQSGYNLLGVMLIVLAAAGIIGVLTLVYNVPLAEATAIALLDRVISVFSVIVLGSIAYVLSPKPSGEGRIPPAPEGFAVPA